MNSRLMPPDLRSFARVTRRPDAGDQDTVDVRGLVRVLWQRRWIVLGFAFGLGLLAWLIVGQMQPTYTALSKVMLDPRKAQIMSGEEVVADLNPSEQVVNGEAAVLRSNVLIEKVVDTLGFEALAPLRPLPGGGALTPEEAAGHRESLVWAIRRDLSVYREGESYVIGIRMDGPDAHLVARIANALAETYILSQIEANQSTTSRATAFLRDRVETLRRDVEDAETAVAAYRSRSLLTEGGSIDTASRQLAELNGQLIAARSDRVTAEARYDQLRTVLDDKGLEAVSALVTSPLIERLTAERIDLTRQEAVWAERYDANHPERVRLQTQLRALDTDLMAEVQKILAQRQGDYEIARLREDTLSQGIKDLENRVLEMSRSELGLRQLQREADATRATYESLLGRLTETRTLEQLQQPDAKLIERATVPGAPSAPRPKLMGAVGVVLGGAIGLGFVFFMEMTAQTFRAAREVETETGLPVLSQLPIQPWKDLLTAAKTLAKEPYSQYGERIRHLRTALLMRDGEDRSRAILLVSSAPDEGKSTTAVALAQMSALAGKSVIVVDGDLRRSTLQRSFGWEMEEDFADFVKGDCALDRAIYSDPEFGFDILAAKGPHPEVADKLSVTWLAPVIEELKRVYDVVLIDAPALLAVSDALVLAQVADTRVYLVRWDSTRRSAVAEGLAAFDEMGLSITGTVLTMVDPERTQDAYGEGYGYSA